MREMGDFIFISSDDWITYSVLQTVNRDPGGHECPSRSIIVNLLLNNNFVAYIQCLQQKQRSPNIFQTEMIRAIKIYENYYFNIPLSNSSCIIDILLCRVEFCINLYIVYFVFRVQV